MRQPQNTLTPQVLKDISLVKMKLGFEIQELLA
jgi:hypothetical protein